MSDYLILCPNFKAVNYLSVLIIAEYPDFSGTVNQSILILGTVNQSILIFSGAVNQSILIFFRGCKPEYPAADYIIGVSILISGAVNHLIILGCVLIIILAIPLRLAILGTWKRKNSACLHSFLAPILL